MKNLKKIMALVIACAMILGTMSLGAFAADDLQWNNTLTVSGIGENDEVAYYQILKWDVDETTGDPANGWVWGNAIDTTKVGTLKPSDFYGANDGQNTITFAKAGQIGAAATTAETTPAGTNSGGTWTVSGVQPGLYMVVVTSKTPGVMYNPIFVAANWKKPAGSPDVSGNSWIVDSATSYSDNAVAKKSTIPLDKTAEGNTDNNNTLNDTDPDTVDVGEVVDFTVTTTIPKFGSNYTNPVFKLHDTLEGLKLTGEPKVYAAAKEDVTATTTPLTKGTDYTLTKGATNDTEYTIQFTKAYLDSVAVTGQDITVKYSAEVTDAAKKMVNQEKNTVDLIFSTSPDDETGKGLLRDETNHFTFSIDADLIGDYANEGSSTEAIKVGQDKEGNDILESRSDYWSTEIHSPLDGAEFKLYTDEACTKLYTNDVFNGTVISDESGRLNIKGLDVGTYYLKETKAPAGWIAWQDPIPVKIEAEIEQNVQVVEEVDDYGTAVEVTYYTNQLKSYSVTVGGSKNTYTIRNSHVDIEGLTDPAISDKELVNTKGVELPSTGGMGTTLFYVIGAILVIGAGVLLVTRRRVNVG